VVTRFTRLHQGAQKGNAANYWTLLEPHYEQNLYTNPKRAAKSQSHTNRVILPVICSIIPSGILFKEQKTVSKNTTRTAIQHRQGTADSISHKSLAHNDIGRSLCAMTRFHLSNKGNPAAKRK
jgi:hypothetical protein